MSTTVCRACGGVNSPLRWACPCCVRATSERLGEIREHAVAIATAGVDGLAEYESALPTGLLVPLDDRSLGDPDPAVVVLAILDALHQVAGHVRHHRGEAEVWRCTIDSESRYLKANAEWCAHQLWGHEFVDVIRQLHARTGPRAVDVPEQVRQAS
jgi:hypothetical protein